MQNALQVSLTDDCCLLVILVSLISSTSSKKGRGYFRTFAFEKNLSILNIFKDYESSHMDKQYAFILPKPTQHAK